MLQLLAFAVGRHCRFVLRTYPFYKKVKIGKIAYYGPKDTITTFEEALNIELPKYDPELHKSLASMQSRVDFFFQEKLHFYYPTGGAFTIPKWTFDYGAEGVCQHIVYCLLGCKYTGVGMRAAVAASEKKNIPRVCINQMMEWIRSHNFPEHWLSTYEKTLDALPQPK